MTDAERVALLESLAYSALIRMDLMTSVLTQEDIAVRDDLRRYFAKDATNG